MTLEIEEMAPFTMDTYCLLPVEEEGEKENGDSLFTSENTMENRWLSCRVNDNGTVDITHKESGIVYREAVMLEDTTDIAMSISTLSRWEKPLFSAEMRKR